MENLYSAPLAKPKPVLDEELAPAKKPKAVTLLQIWILVLVAILAAGFMKNLHNLDGRYYSVIFGISGKGRGFIMAGMIVFSLLTLFLLDRRTLPGRV